MSGWPAVTIIIIAQMAVAALLALAAAWRWWDYLVIAVLTAVLVRPTAHHVTGDVSRYLPYAIWSDDSEGKDQVILASVASTVLLPLMASALAVYVVNKIWRALRTARKDEAG
jgi:hypothetical protein